MMWSRTNNGTVLLRRHLRCRDQIRASRTTASASVSRPSEESHPRPSSQPSNLHRHGSDGGTKLAPPTEDHFQRRTVHERQDDNRKRAPWRDTKGGGPYSPPAPPPQRPPPRSTPPSSSPTNFRDERLPCREHLDPGGQILPTSRWIQLTGTLPITSLKEVVSAVEGILIKEASHPAGIVDLDAPWNPLRDKRIPRLRTTGGVIAAAPGGHVGTDHRRYDDDDDDSDDEEGEDWETDGDVTEQQQRRPPAPPSSLFQVRAVHVTLSPFGRPNGWKVELANSSLVNAILTRASDMARGGNGCGVRVGWKLVQVEEIHDPPPEDGAEPSADGDDGGKAKSGGSSSRRSSSSGSRRSDGGTGVAEEDVDDSMVRIENCPPSLDKEHLRYLLSRYDLAPTGDTILQWAGRTNDGREPPLTYVVRFASPAWARAAVRELQATWLDGKMIKLVQYPNQMRSRDR